jgi:hypothetical protein
MGQRIIDPPADHWPTAANASKEEKNMANTTIGTLRDPETQKQTRKVIPQANSKGPGKKALAEF